MARLCHLFDFPQWKILWSELLWYTRFATQQILTHTSLAWGGTYFLIPLFRAWLWNWIWSMECLRTRLLERCSLCFHSLALCSCTSPFIVRGVCWWSLLSKENEDSRGADLILTLSYTLPVPAQLSSHSQLIAWSRPTLHNSQTPEQKTNACLSH